LYDRDIPSKVFYSNYIQTYVERDISELVQVRDLGLFRKFVKLCAARVGQLLNLNSLANECGVSQPTAKSWITLLESSYVVFLLYPYFENFNKRIVKTPKLYFYDTGLAAHLTNQTNPEKLKISSNKGHLFENMVIAELIKRNEHNYKQKEFWFWRDSAGHEIDLLVLGDDNMLAVEVKATQTIMSDLFKGLEYFEDLLQVSNKSCQQYLIYAGNSGQKRTTATVLPWHKAGDLL
jgi:predicted AAA+ superfamily ATPase